MYHINFDLKGFYREPATSFWKNVNCKIENLEYVPLSNFSKTIFGVE